METRLADAFRIGAIASRRSRLLNRPFQLCPIPRASLPFARPILGRRQVAIRPVEQTERSIDRGRF